jgi:hypothetical protein
MVFSREKPPGAIFKPVLLQQLTASASYRGFAGPAPRPRPAAWSDQSRRGSISSSSTTQSSPSGCAFSSISRGISSPSAVHPRQGFASDCHRCAGPCPRGRSGLIFPPAAGWSRSQARPAPAHCGGGRSQSRSATMKEERGRRRSQTKCDNSTRILTEGGLGYQGAQKPRQTDRTVLEGAAGRLPAQ